MHLVTVVGARPQFIKLAPLSRALRADGIDEVIVHTGQHYDHGMSAVFFEELSIAEPDYNLAAGSGNHGAQTGEMLRKIEDVLITEEPDWVMVYGDTNSTLAGALAAVKLHIPVAHVEAGLRSFNRRMPEEINRVLTDHVSSLMFCPTETAVNNLANEGITQRVHLVGDVMLDALMQARERAKDRSIILSHLGVTDRQYILATVHRPENTDDPQRLRSIITALTQLAETEPVIFPAHPRTRSALEALGYQIDTQVGSHSAAAVDYPRAHQCTDTPSTGIRFIAPLGYLDMVRLSDSARVILTDSGGLQKEAFWLGTPCVTLRNETEWVETVQSGGNRLCPPENAEAIVKEAREAASAGGQEVFGQCNSSASTRCAQLLNQVNP